MKQSIVRLIVGFGCVVAAFVLSISKACAQQDMSNMPGMPGMSPTPPATPEASASPTPTPASPQEDMESMSGMKGGAKKSEMPDMPGMGGMDRGSKMKGMAGMNESTPQRPSAPGIYDLAPPQEWTPPPGDDRRGELMSREALLQHMAPLASPIGDGGFYALPFLDLLEYRFNSSGPDTFVWDFVGWFGGDYNRLWIKTEGRQALSQGSRGEGDLQIMYGRLISAYWDFQIGGRVLTNLGNGAFRRNARTYAVIGFQGIAPGNFDVEPALYISDRGEVSGELTMSVDVYLTQRLILQPRFQGEVTVQGDRRFETGAGGVTTDMGLRLRYDIRREIQPYIGVSWLRSFGPNARLARDAGGTADTIGLVAGLQLWW